MWKIYVQMLVYDIINRTFYKYMVIFLFCFKWSSNIPLKFSMYVHSLPWKILFSPMLCK